MLSDNIVVDVWEVKWGFDRVDYFHDIDGADEFCEKLIKKYYGKETLSRPSPRRVKAIVDGLMCYPIDGHRIHHKKSL